MQLDMFGATDVSATRSAAPPTMVADTWMPPETLAFDGALRRRALVDALSVLNRLRVNAASRVLLASGFAVGSSASRASLMAPAQRDIIEAARRGMNGHELRVLRAGLELVDTTLLLADVAAPSTYISRQMQRFNDEYPGGPEDDFSRMVFDSAREHQEHYSKIMVAHDGQPDGMEFQNGDGVRYAVIVPEMSDPERGSYRLQYFDKDGFSSHETVKDIEAAVELMVESGFVNQVQGALEQMAVTPEWNRGIELTGLIARLNGREITHAEYAMLVSKVDERYSERKSERVDLGMDGGKDGAFDAAVAEILANKLNIVEKLGPAARIFEQILAAPTLVDAEALYAQGQDEVTAARNTYDLAFVLAKTLPLTQVLEKLKVRTQAVWDDDRVLKQQIGRMRQSKKKTEAWEDQEQRYSLSMEAIDADIASLDLAKKLQAEQMPNLLTDRFVHQLLNDKADDAGKMRAAFTNVNTLSRQSWDGILELRALQAREVAANIATQITANNLGEFLEPGAKPEDVEFVRFADVKLDIITIDALESLREFGDVSFVDGFGKNAGKRSGDLLIMQPIEDDSGLVRNGVSVHVGTNGKSTVEYGAVHAGWQASRDKAVFDSANREELQFLAAVNRIYFLERRKGLSVGNVSAILNQLHNIADTRGTANYAWALAELHGPGADKHYSGTHFYQKLTQAAFVQFKLVQEVQVAVVHVDHLKTRMVERAPVVAPEGWIVMNAPRPLLGNQTMEGAFLSGRFYAAIDPLDSMAAAFIKENEKLDARMVVVVSREMQMSMALHGNKYRDQYLALDAQTRFKDLSVTIRKLQDMQYGELLKLMEVAREGAASVLQPMAVMDGVKEPWQMTREEFRFTKNALLVEAIHAGIVKGDRIILATNAHGILFSRPDQIRIASSGEVQIPAGHKWVSLVESQVEYLASQTGFPVVPFEEKEFHGGFVRNALIEGKSVPAEVLAQYPKMLEEIEDMNTVDVDEQEIYQEQDAIVDVLASTEKMVDKTEQELIQRLSARWAAVKSISGSHYKDDYKTAGLTFIGDGKIKSVIKDDVVVGAVEGRFGRQKLYDNLVEGVQKDAKEVAGILIKEYQRLEIPVGYKFSFDAKSDIQSIETMQLYQFSAFISLPGENAQNVENQVATELRVSFDANPRAILFMNKGERWAGKNKSVLEGADEKFPKAETYTELAGKIVDTFNRKIQEHLPDVETRSLGVISNGKDAITVVHIAEDHALPADVKVVANGLHIGRVDDVRGGFVVQDGGLGVRVAHVACILDKVPVVGEMVQVAYAQGLGKVSVRGLAVEKGAQGR